MDDSLEASLSGYYKCLQIEKMSKIVPVLYATMSTFMGFRREDFKLWASVYPWPFKCRIQVFRSYGML